MRSGSRATRRFTNSTTSCNTWGSSPSARQCRPTNTRRPCSCTCVAGSPALPRTQRVPPGPPATCQSCAKLPNYFRLLPQEREITTDDTVPTDRKDQDEVTRVRGCIDYPCYPCHPWL